jgi:hypothetical protein
MKIAYLFGAGTYGKSAFVTKERRLNVYFEQRADGDKSKVVIYGTPGLQPLCAIPGVYNAPARAMWGNETSLYVIASNLFQKIDLSGNSLFSAGLGTPAGLCAMAPSSTEILITDGSLGYVFNIAAQTFVQQTAGWFVQGAQTCTYVAGYFLAEQPGTNRVGVSGGQGALTGDATSFFGANQVPGDTVVAVDNLAGNAVIFCTQHMEFWQNVGTPYPQPFAPILSATNGWGLDAIWSRAHVDEALIFLGETAQGTQQVVRVDGYTAKVISDPDLEYIWNAPGFRIDDATALTYQQDHHKFYQLTFPSMNRSFLFDCSSGLWSETQTGVTTYYAQRHIGNISGYTGISGPKTIIADYSTSQLYIMSPLQYTDNGNTIPREIITKHANSQFNRFSSSVVYFDFEVGVGAPGTTPYVMIQVSRNNGNDWGPEIWKALGNTAFYPTAGSPQTPGNYRNRIMKRRNGSARDFLYRIKSYSPSKFVVTAAAVGTRQRQAQSQT